MKYLLLLLFTALVFSPAVLVRSQRPRQDLPVAYWEGKIRVEKTYDGKQGKYKWIGEYRVLLREEEARSGVSDLNPLELDYSIDADVTLDQDCYGVYHEESHDWRMLGKASGQLRHSSVRAKNVVAAPGSSYRRLGGAVDHNERLVGRTHESSNEMSDLWNWQHCGDNRPAQSYRIWIDLETSDGSGWAVEEVVSLFEGIRRAGDGLTRALSQNPVEFLTNGGGHELFQFHICGVMERPYQEALRGSHSLSSWELSGICNTSSNDSPTTLNITWELRRTRSNVELFLEKNCPGLQGAYATCKQQAESEYQKCTETRRFSPLSGDCLGKVIAADEKCKRRFLDKCLNEIRKIGPDPRPQTLPTPAQTPAATEPASSSNSGLDPRSSRNHGLKMDHQL